ncbi:MAG: nuclear transport factor 2 family protein [Solirubrobacterales bacterium]|nr:nuclear transport factor 2 family protein [Solirubrobacterales bacterium]
MRRTPLEVVQDFLAHAFNPDEIDDAVERLVAPDATYVSLSYDDPELNRIMPWAGTKHGAQAFIDNFKGVRAHWWNDTFGITDTVEQDGKVAIFGHFTLRSVTLNQAAESPFVVFAKVEDERITYFQYMEDTFATARTFREGGTWTIRADPADAEPIQV